MLTAELEKVTISADATVRTALQRLCENGQQILFVTENGILRASLRAKKNLDVGGLLRFHQ